MRTFLDIGYFGEHGVAASCVAPYGASVGVAACDAHHFLFSAAEGAAEDGGRCWCHIGL